MNTRLEIGSVNVTIRTVPTYNADGSIEIPPNLVTLTETLIALHKANGDLAWLADMVAVAEVFAPDCPVPEDGDTI